MLIVGVLYDNKEVAEVQRIVKYSIVAQRFGEIGHKALMLSKLKKLKNKKEVATKCKKQPI